MSIGQDLQKPAVGKVVRLFTIDLTALGGPVFRCTPNTVLGMSAVSFGGNTYMPFPISMSGLSTSIDGSPPQPALEVSNVTRYFAPYVAEYGDLLGGKVSVVETLDKYLDTGSSPDSSQIFNSGVYLIEQKTKDNKRELGFRLVSVIDAPDFKLPRGQVTRAIFPGVDTFRRQ